jgi:hypothetical protein
MPLIPKQKEKKFRKYMAAVLIGAMLFTTSAPLPARAGVWGEAMMSQFVKQVLEVIFEQIMALLLGIAKRVAIQLARDAANKLVAGGASKKPVFITDYKAYIYGAALDESLVYMNDLMTTATGGKNSSLNYLINGGSVQRLGMDYLAHLNNEVNAAFAKDSCKYTLDQYSSDTVTAISVGDWRVLNATVGSNCNNALGMSQQMKEAAQRRREVSQEQAKARAIAGKGFTGVEVNGKIISPGSVIGDITSSVQNEVTGLIGKSSKWGELLAAAAGAFANQALNNMYQRGFEEVSKVVSRELGNVDKKIAGERRNMQRTLGPGSQFLRNVSQQRGGTNGKYTGVQQSVVNFNPVPGCRNEAGLAGC